ncbi:MAG: hypothetical protein U0793_32695 [Gemmataceae bacterium]
MLVSDNETWVIDTGDWVIRKKARDGKESLSPWERLIYCLWVADYAMRNGGSLDGAREFFGDVFTEGKDLAEQLAYPRTLNLFSKPLLGFEKAYLDAFDSVCAEIRAGEVPAIRN